MSDEDAVYELSIDQPNLPKGEPVQIPGLGTFENGRSYTVTKEEAEAFRTYHTKQETVVDDETGAILGSQPTLGPTLLQAAKSMYGVEVTTAESSGNTRRSASTSAVTSTSADTSKTTPNAEAVKLQNDKPSTEKSAEGGEN